jgi:hypothetical protein
VGARRGAGSTHHGSDAGRASTPPGCQAAALIGVLPTSWWRGMPVPTSSTVAGKHFGRRAWPSQRADRDTASCSRRGESGGARPRRRAGAQGRQAHRRVI